MANRRKPAAASGSSQTKTDRDTPADPMMESFLYVYETSKSEKKRSRVREKLDGWQEVV